jgi:soluble lytic murein transglycosylase-like protein
MERSSQHRSRCLALPATSLLCALFLFLALPASAADTTTSDAVTSTVRVDRRSGKLIRRILVPERVIQAQFAGATPSPDTQSRLAPGTRVDAIVEDVASRYNVDPLLVHAIIHVESRYNPFAISPKGAEGLMQLIPSTARQMGVRNSFDSRDNIEGGIRYLQQLQNRFSDLRLVLAAYNAGEHAVARFGGIPPYAETQEYVYKVGRRYGELRRTQKQSTARAAQPDTPVQPEHRPLETYVDEEGRLHLRTR